MADNVPITPGAGKDIATDDVSSVHYQKIKVDLGGDGVSSPLVRGQQTKANSIPVTHASDDTVAVATGSKIQITDGTDDVTVSVAGARKPMDMHLIDAAGNVVSSFGGAGGTSATDDADFTALSTVGTPVMGVYESSPTSITDGDMGIGALDQNRRWKVSLDASTLDVDHDAVDAGRPTKIGGKARTTLPAAVAANDRTDASFDTMGRQLVSHIDPAAQVWKSANYTSQQTGSTIWDPTSGKRIAITHLQVDSYGTVGGRIFLWFGDNADTTYTAGTDQPLFVGSHAPSTTSKPGALPPIPHPIFCTTADRELHITTDAGISLDVVVYGYEW
jgi:hypothetical protein